MAGVAGINRGSNDRVCRCLEAAGYCSGSCGLTGRANKSHLRQSPENESIRKFHRCVPRLMKSTTCLKNAIMAPADRESQEKVRIERQRGTPTVMSWTVCSHDTARICPTAKRRIPHWRFPTARSSCAPRGICGASARKSSDRPRRRPQSSQRPNAVFERRVARVKIGEAGRKPALRLLTVRCSRRSGHILARQGLRVAGGTFWWVAEAGMPTPDAKVRAGSCGAVSVICRPHRR